MELVIWSLIFVISVCGLIKASDWLVLGFYKFARVFEVNASRTHLSAALMGVALPELAASMAAVMQGKPELVASLAIGSSIVNILLVIGLSALAAGSVSLKKEQIDNDLPLFIAAVAAFYFIAADGSINMLEGIVMILMFFMYSSYIAASCPRRDITTKDIITPELLDGLSAAQVIKILPTRFEKKLETLFSFQKQSWGKTLLLLFGGAGILFVASNFAIGSLSAISNNNLPLAVSVMIVLSIGTALPEMFASLRAVSSPGRERLTIGNLFAATVANLLLVCGLSSLSAPLVLGAPVLTVGLPFLIASSLLMAISVIPGKINSGQGALFLFLYFIFFVKILGLF